MVRAPALVLSLLILLVAAPAASAAVIPGAKAGDSVLFAMDASSGTLKPAKKDDRYVLTLKGVDRRATWFADRPRRDAGQLATKRLFGSWKRLGFTKVPPNAALVVEGAKAKRDTMAVELKLRSYKPKARTATFAVRRLGSLGVALRHLNQRIDQRVPKTFGTASLFIDNTSEGTCTLGQPTLQAGGDGMPVEDMIPANGSTLSVEQNTALFSIYGTQYGGDGTETFQVPKIPAPAPNTSWYVCTEGIYPQAEALGGQCPVGEVDFFALPNIPSNTISDPDWLPADGRRVSAAQYSTYASLFSAGNPDVTLPSVPAPPGLTAYVCVQGTIGALSPYMGELALYPPQPALPEYQNIWQQANGSSVSISTNEPLAAILGDFGPGQTFALPNVPATGATGASWYIAVEGLWPFG
jgi:microcystin-dependent protein